MYTQITQPHILWADDDPDDRSLIKEVLQEFDYTVALVEAENGKQALDYLQSVHDPDRLPCLIVLDLNMPGMNGKQTLQALKKHERYRSIPVVVFTTSSSESDKEFCRNYQTPLFTKPINYRALTTTICEILGYCEAADITAACAGVHR